MSEISTLRFSASNSFRASATSSGATPSLRSGIATRIVACRPGGRRAGGAPGHGAPDLEVAGVGGGLAAAAVADVAWGVGPGRLALVDGAAVAVADVGHGHEHERGDARHGPENCAKSG